VIKGSIKLSSINALVFDEADRMLDMGFIDEIKRILRHVPKERQTLLFSATFDDSIFKLSKQLLNDPKLVEVNKRNSAAVEVEQLVYAVDEDRKRELVSHMIGMKNWQQVLIFTRTKQTADLLAKEMCKDGLKTESIHGDKSQGARDKALQNFKSGATRVLVATDVAARGIDVDGVTHVINFDLPNEPESYVHRIGRTARAGATGISLSFCDHEERPYLRDIEKVIRQQVPVMEDHPFHQEGMELKNNGAGGKEEKEPSSRPDAPKRRNNSGKHKPNRRINQPKSHAAKPGGGGGQRKGRPANKRARPASA